MNAPLPTIEPALETVHGEREAEGFMTAMRVSLCTGEELLGAITRASVNPYRLAGFARRLQKELERAR